MIGNTEIIDSSSWAIPIMVPTFEKIDDDIFEIREVFTRKECATLIARAESVGFEPASVRAVGGRRMMTNIRNNDRVELCDAILADKMWKRVEHVLPVLDDAAPYGVDTQLRFYRYAPGQRFNCHKDGVVRDDIGHKSKLSYLIYLNDDYEGGATVFRKYGDPNGMRWQPEHAVYPSTGNALLFRHERWHEGMPVISGTKYVLRSDVFYNM